MCDWDDDKWILTALNKQNYNTRGTKFLDSISSKTYCIVKLYIPTYPFTIFEYITIPVTQKIHYFNSESKQGVENVFGQSSIMKLFWERWFDMILIKIYTALYSNKKN